MYRASGKEMPDKISCECPLADRNVEFEMEAFKSKELEQVGARGRPGT